MEPMTKEKIEEIKAKWAKCREGFDKIDQCVSDLENCQTEIVRNMIVQMIIKYSDSVGVKLV